jgi:hypothetical protein
MLPFRILTPDGPEIEDAGRIADSIEKESGREQTLCANLRREFVRVSDSEFGGCPLTIVNPTNTLDGKRFLYALPEAPDPQAPIIMMLNWQQNLKKK